MLLSMMDRFSPETKQRERLGLDLLRQQIASGGGVETRAQQAESRAQAQHEYTQQKAQTIDPIALDVLREQAGSAKFANEQARLKGPYEVESAQIRPKMEQQVYETARDLSKPQVGAAEAAVDAMKQQFGEREKKIPLEIRETDQKFRTGEQSLRHLEDLFPHVMRQTKAGGLLTEAQAAAVPIDAESKRMQAQSIKTGAESDSANAKRQTDLKYMEHYDAAGRRGTAPQMNYDPEGIMRNLPSVYQRPMDPGLPAKILQDLYSGGPAQAEAVRRIMIDPRLRAAVEQMEPDLEGRLKEEVQRGVGQPGTTGAPQAQPQEQPYGAHRTPRTPPQQFARARQESREKHMDPRALFSFPPFSTLYHGATHAAESAGIGSQQMLQDPVLSIRDYIQNMLDPEVFRRKQEEERRKLGY